jgi:hypothetical protein
MNDVYQFLLVGRFPEPLVCKYNVDFKVRDLGYGNFQVQLSRNPSSLYQQIKISTNSCFLEYGLRNTSLMYNSISCPYT